jgi:hypothetical protein
MLPPSSGLKNMPRKKQHEEGSSLLKMKHTSICKFWRNMSCSSSGTKTKPSKKPAQSRQQAELCLLFNSVNGGDMFFQNVQ